MTLAHRQRVTDLVVYALLAVIMAFLMLPIVWLFQTAFKPGREAFAIPPVWVFWPTLENFYAAFKMAPALQYLRNSVIIATGTMTLAMLLGVPAGYGLARSTARVSTRLALLVLAIRMTPPVALLIPFYMLMRDLGLLGTYLAVILLQSVFNVPFVTWMMRGFFLSLPADLEDAALTDGCSRFGAFWRISLPLSAPGLATAAIFAFTLSWNDFLLPLLLSGRTTRTLTLGIMETFTTYDIGWSRMAAIGIVTVLPVLVLGFFLQRYYIRGLTMGAIRE
jgi:multiple sugar transport system permease protein